MKTKLGPTTHSNEEKEIEPDPKNQEEIEPLDFSLNVFEEDFGYVCTYAWSKALAESQIQPVADKNIDKHSPNTKKSTVSDIEYNPIYYLKGINASISLYELCKIPVIQKESSTTHC